MSPTRALSLILLISLAATIACQTKAPAPAAASTPKPYTCVAGANEQCASDLWYKDYQRLKALREKYSAPPDEADLMAGIELRLTQQVPQGYRWDVEKERFVKLPPPAVTPPVEGKK